MRRVSGRLMAAIACWTIATAPAAATEDVLRVRPEPSWRSPELAAGLAVATPLTLLLVSSQSSDFLVTFGVPVLGLAGGHIYAGDPLRGGLVAIASSLAGTGVFTALNPSGGNGGGGAYVVALLGASVAMGIAATDAYLTAQEKNRQLSEAHSTIGVPPDIAP